MYVHILYWNILEYVGEEKKNVLNIFTTFVGLLFLIYVSTYIQKPCNLKQKLSNCLVFLIDETICMGTQSLAN